MPRNSAARNPRLLAKLTGDTKTCTMPHLDQRGRAAARWTHASRSRRDRGRFAGQLASPSLYRGMGGLPTSANVGNQRLATFRKPHRRSLSRVRCIALLADCGNRLPPQDAAIGNPENPRRFRGLPEWKKAMDGFFHGQLALSSQQQVILCVATNPKRIGRPTALSQASRPSGESPTA